MPDPAAAGLAVTGIDTFYGRKQVLFGMSLVVPLARVTALMGRNGMGKTTTIRSIMGFTPATRGTIHFDGQDITRLPPHQVARSGIGLVPEGRRLFANLTVEENLVATATRGPQRAGWTLDRIYTLFPRVAERRRNMATHLSGGEQQMVAIGRALMTNPRLILLDEATEGLAPMIRHEIWQALAHLRAEGCGVLVIDKNLQEFAELVDALVVMQTGRVVWSGTAPALLADRAVAQTYLGL